MFVLQYWHSSMPEFDFTAHAIDMLKERNISEDWVWRAVNNPDKKRMGDDGNMHHTKALKERKHRIVTIFFDRRLMRTK